MGNQFFTHKTIQFRSHNLDILRFTMALWVLLAHGIAWAVQTNTIDKCNILNKLNSALWFLFQTHGETHPAVLTFIILSGYCIHRNGFRLNREISFKSFGIRRGFRILPVYWIGIILGAALFKMSMGINSFLAKSLSGTEEIKSFFILWKIIGISNFLPSLHVSIFQGNAPLVTVMVEIWLYFLYAIIFFMVTRGITLKNIMRFFLFLWVCTLLYVTLNSSCSSWWHNGCFISFFPYWWFGVYLAEWGGEKKFYSPKWVKIALLSIFLGSFAKCLFLNELKKVGLAYFIGLFLLSLERKNKNYFPLLSKAGKMSYSLYALHAPLVIFLLLSGVGLFYTISLVLGVSLVCFLVIENPLLEYGKNLLKK